MKKIKADISLGATPKEREDVAKRYMKIQRLLIHFDLNAFAFDPGVKCLIMYEKLSMGERANYIDFDGETWKFMEPLLKELVQWREYGKKFNMYMSKKERRKNETISKRS
jgi:hypothetical protein